MPDPEYGEPAPEYSSYFAPNTISAAFDPGPMPITEAEAIAERRKYHIQQCVAVLRQAYNIRHDAKLMAEIQLHLRNEKDEITDLLDEIQ